ncbi:unnamed protein product [Gongylonema pulchrum]|uniref:Glyco_transf_64 domain-containing protein n=1 Tax=Gongylonema pulchrum TaxID=637853 RepID=A0A183DZ86_9BILA|nr:unnamed protein product [Gongylonema pulchrum]
MAHSSTTEWPQLNRPTHIIQMDRNLLSNRFILFSEITTEAVFSLDDDITALSVDEIEFAYQVRLLFFLFHFASFVIRLVMRFLQLCNAKTHIGVVCVSVYLCVHLLHTFISRPIKSTGLKFRELNLYAWAGRNPQNGRHHPCGSRIRARQSFFWVSS